MRDFNWDKKQIQNTGTCITSKDMLCSGAENMLGSGLYFWYIYILFYLHKIEYLPEVFQLNVHPGFKFLITCYTQTKCCTTQKFPYKNVSNVYEYFAEISAH
jgi:hypothetical protein